MLSVKYVALFLKNDHCIKHPLLFYNQDTFRCGSSSSPCVQCQHCATVNACGLVLEFGEARPCFHKTCVWMLVKCNLKTRQFGHAPIQKNISLEQNKLTKRRDKTLQRASTTEMVVADVLSMLILDSGIVLRWKVYCVWALRTTPRPVCVCQVKTKCQGKGAGLKKVFWPLIKG